MDIKYFKITFDKKIQYISSNDVDIDKFKNKKYIVEEITEDEYKESVFKYYIVYDKRTNEVLKFIETKIDSDSHFRKEHVFSDNKDFKNVPYEFWKENRKTFFTKEIEEVTKIENQEEIDHLTKLLNLQIKMQTPTNELIEVPDPIITKRLKGTISKRKKLEDFNL